MHHFRGVERANKEQGGEGNNKKGGEGETYHVKAVPDSDDNMLLNLSFLTPQRVWEVNKGIMLGYMQAFYGKGFHEDFPRAFLFKVFFGKNFLAEILGTFWFKGFVAVKILWGKFW